MRLDKVIYNMQRRRNKRQSNGVMLEMMTSKMTLDLNVLSSFMKNRVVSNLNRTLIVTIHRSEMKKENLHKCK
jgi:archaellum biogenesis ATPase FlaH